MDLNVEKLPQFQKFSENVAGRVSRRNFLKVSSIGISGLILGVHTAVGKTKRTATNFSPNVYLSITPGGEVIIVAHRSEMGQGVRTSLPMIIADELEADWSRVRVIQAEGDEKKYGNQNTDGSFSVRKFYEPLRQAGATARTLLEQAASLRWKVQVNECKAKDHYIWHTPTGKKLGFGELVTEAAALDTPDPSTIKLKQSSQFNLIGKKIPIVDLQDIVTGKATFGIDASLPSMRTAVIARCPVVGGKAQSFDDTKTRQIPGVLGVIALEGAGLPPQFGPLGGVAVVAGNTWSAMKGRDALQVTWDEGPNASYDSEEQLAEMERNLASPGTLRRQTGNGEQAFKGDKKILETVYTLPYYAHGMIEPPCALANVLDGSCEVWAPVQHPQWARTMLAQALGIDESKVKVNVTLLGGAFGRKSKPDFILEAALLSQKSGQPIKLIWTREDDLHHDFYHAQSVQRIRVAINKNNEVEGWDHRIAYPPIGGTSDTSAKQPSDLELSMGAMDLPYAIPSVTLQTYDAKAHTRIGWLRSVANIQQAFAIGSMIDEIAAARQKDPLENLLELLGEDRVVKFDGIKGELWNYREKINDYPWETSRMKAVINLVANKAGWGNKLPQGSGIGIAAHRSFLSYIACVVKVNVQDGNPVSIPEVHYALDCGVFVNRDRVISQFEGGAVFGLSLAMTSRISMKKGRVQQSNFDTYQVPRMPQSPESIHVHIVENDEKPAGVGEPPVPPFTAAFCNAIFNATGKRMTKLPIALQS